MARRVSVVFDPGFGEKLANLAMKTEVWIVESEVNRRAADDAWTMAQEWPQISVTVFNAPAEVNAESLRMVLDLIEMHHRPATRRVGFDTIDVIGSELTDDAREVLASFGFSQTSLTKEGYRAARR